MGDFNNEAVLHYLKMVLNYIRKGVIDMANLEIEALRSDAKEFQPTPEQRLNGTDYLCAPQPPRPGCTGGPCRPAPCRPNCNGQLNK